MSELEHDYEIRMAHFKESYDAGVRAKAEGKVSVADFPEELNNLQAEAWIGGYHGDDWKIVRKRIEEKA